MTALGRAAAAGLLYFTTVFAAGVVLGTLRVAVLAPALGPLGATLAELPLILGFAWIAAGRLTRRLSVPRGAARLVMGEIAFLLLIGAELLLGAAMGMGPAEVVAGWARPAGAAGLAAQVLFGLFPWLQGRREAGAEG